MPGKQRLCSIKLDGPFDKVRKKINRALQETGFEVICEINFSELIENRLGIKIKEYHILEILDPYTAFQFLLTELQAGLFIPLRLVICEDNSERITVFVLDPEEATNLTDNAALKLIGGEASEKLVNTLAGLRGPI